MRAMPLTLTLTALTGTIVAACAAYGGPAAAPYRAAASDPRACFYAPQVRGFRSGPNDSIIVNSSSRDYFLLQASGPCPNLNFGLNVAIRTRGDNYVCAGEQADLFVRGVQGPEYCPVTSVRRLTPAEITAFRAGTFK